MNFYDDLVMQTQMNYSKYYPIYASGSTPYQLTDKKPLPYSEQIHRLVQEVKEADCVVVGGASGLSAAGGGTGRRRRCGGLSRCCRPAIWTPWKSWYKAGGRGPGVHAGHFLTLLQKSI